MVPIFLSCGGNTFKIFKSDLRGSKKKLKFIGLGSACRVENFDHGLENPALSLWP